MEAGGGVGDRARSFAEATENLFFHSLMLAVM